VACYEPVDASSEDLLVCPAGVVCSRCIRIATGSPYWIYIGEDTSIVVQAGSHDEAVRKVLKNHMYDRFGLSVVLVSDFEKRCRVVG
jgi:hypothetical protein